MFGRARRRELEFNRQWGDLATYNTEVAHGIVHTPEYDEKMRLKQVDYDRWSIEQLEKQGPVYRIGERDAAL